MTVVLAALASISTREPYLANTLATLRPQVDRIHVYLNGYESVPQCVHELADDHILDPDNAGAERKFWWAEKHDGLYFSCDDDIVYPPDYVATLRAELLEHCGIVTAHGRQYDGRPATVHSVVPGSVGMFHKRVDYGRPINHGGTGVMAWDAAQVHVPPKWPLQNMADMQLAVWAQRHRVPMWLVKHQAHWLSSPAVTDPKGLFHKSRIEGHRRRNRLLRDYGASNGWRMCGSA